MCCLLFQSPASPTDGLRHTSCLPSWVAELNWTPMSSSKRLCRPIFLPRACRVHAGLPKGAVCVGLSSCTGTECGRGSFWECSPMTAKGLLPPYGFAWRGLGQGTRVEEVAAGGANCSLLPCPSRLGSPCALVPLTGWGLGSHSADCISVAEQQGFPKAAPSVQGTCSSGLPRSRCALPEFVPNPIPAV